MELRRDRHWFDDDHKLTARTSYEHHTTVLPSRVVAEYYEGDIDKLARFWITEASLPEAQPDSSPSAYDDTSLTWVAANCDSLYQLYPNQWILIEGRCVIASSENPQELATLAEKRGMPVAFITRVAPPSKRQIMVYAR